MLNIGDEVRVINPKSKYYHQTGYIRYIDKFDKCKVSLNFVNETIDIYEYNLRKLTLKEHYSILFRLLNKHKAEYDKEPDKITKMIIDMIEYQLHLI
jgi:hypothetical protein